MADRKQALTDLLEKVEDGGEDNPNFSSMVNRPIMQCKAGEAYRGSLDAAKALHEAVLPGWDFDIDSVTGVCVYIENPDMAFVGRVDVNNPARAWLIAILKALIAQED